MKRRLALCAVLALLTAGLSGCWDSREVTAIDVVTSISIDRGDAPDSIKLCAQISQGKLTEGANGIALSNIANIIYTTTGKNVVDCLSKLATQTTYSLFLPQNQVIIVGREAAEDGLTKVLNYFLRSYECRFSEWLFVAEDSAEDIIKANVDHEDSVAIALTNLMNKDYNLSAYSGVTLLDYYREYAKEATSMMVPVISLIHEKEYDRYAIENMAVMREDRMAGTLSNQDVQGINWLMGRVQESNLISVSEYGEITYISSSEKCRIVPRFADTGEVSLDVHISTDIFPLDVNVSGNLSADDLNAVLPLNAKLEIRNIVETAFKKTQQMSADVCGIGNLIYTWHPKKWAALKDNWPETLRNIDIQLYIDVKIPYPLKFNTLDDIKEILDRDKSI